MPYISDTILTIEHRNGQRAAYIVQPQHLPRDHIPESVNWPMQHGKLIAMTDRNGDWISSQTMQPITDRKAVALIERAQVITQPEEYNRDGVRITSSFNTPPVGETC